MEEPLINENLCCICLEPCETKTSCKCNSFIHDKCDEELKIKWKENYCPYCMVRKKNKPLKPLKIFLSFFIIFPFFFGLIFFIITDTDTDKWDKYYIIFYIWFWGFLIQSAFGAFFLLISCYEDAYSYLSERRRRRRIS